MVRIKNDIYSYAKEAADKESVSFSLVITAAHKHHLSHEEALIVAAHYLNKITGEMMKSSPHLMNVCQNQNLPPLLCGYMAHILGCGGRG